MATSRNSPWLFGALPDLALGCGLGYAAIFMVFAWGGEPLRLAQPVFLAPLLSVIFSAPHYGATLLRVYERRADRQAYVLFSVWATLLVFAVFVTSLRNAAIASWFYTLFMTWSPWHYTGQNYGLCVMFLRRGGIEVSPLAKRLLYTSFISSFLITFLVLHNLPDVAGYNPSPSDYDDSTLVSPRILGIPYDFARSAMFVVTCVHVASLLGAFGLLARGASSLRALLPAGALVATQALWFTLPFSLPFWDIRTGIDPLDAGVPAQYVFWIAIGHALQYLWVTTYYARASSNWQGYRSYLGKVAAAGTAIWTVPAILFAPDAMGNPEFAGGLAILVASAVNIHHFILDGAIWKLRSGRIAGVLVRSQKEQAEVAEAPARRWPLRLFWAACGSFILIRIGAVELEHHVFPAAVRSGHLAGAELTLDALAWLGRDGSSHRLRLARAYARAGESDAAEAQYLRSLELRPRMAAWVGLAEQRTERKDWPGVWSVYEEARQRGPLPLQLRGLAMQAGYQTGRTESARAILDGIARDEAGSAGTYTALAHVAYRQGDVPTAARAYRRALELEPGRASAANGLAWILATAEDPALRAPEEAVALAEDAARSSDPPDANYLDTLAAAYAANGRHEEAVDAATRAVELATAAGELDVARAARRNLERYRSAVDGS